MPSDFITVSDVRARAALSKVTTIYTDLDGTLFAPGGRLLVNTEGEPSLALAAAMVALRQAGITLIAVTGRNKMQGMEIIRILNLHAFIAEMGTAIIEFEGFRNVSRYDTGDFKWDANNFETPYEAIIASGIVDKLLSTYKEKLEINSPWHKNRDVTVSLRGHVNVEEANTFIAEHGIGLVLLDNGIISPFAHTLKDVDEFHGYHLVPKNTSKELAIARDMKQRGLTKEEVLSIGDGYSDAQCAKSSGVFIAMQRTLEQKSIVELLKKLPAKVFVTEKHAADGWVEFANALLASREFDTHNTIKTIMESSKDSTVGSNFLSLY